MNFIFLDKSASPLRTNTVLHNSMTIRGCSNIIDFFTHASIRLAQRLLHRNIHLNRRAPCILNVLRHRVVRSLRCRGTFRLRLSGTKSCLRTYVPDVNIDPGQTPINHPIYSVPPTSENSCQRPRGDPRQCDSPERKNKQANTITT